MKNNGIIVSSRIRLARNVADLAFPARLEAESADGLVDKVFSAVKSYDDNVSLHKMAQIDELDKEVLKEKRLISEDLLNINPCAAVIISDNEDISIMVNEEDHLRLQSFTSGLDIPSAYDKIDKIDDVLSSAMKMAFSTQYGYLTACPSNIGTGMRASAMMFLPGLTITGSLQNCIANSARLDITLRGDYGEGSSSEGYMYQVSNQKTLGMSEQEIIESVSTTVGSIAQQEEQARQLILKQNPIEIKDKIMRAFGTLTNAYVMTGDEFVSLLALVKLGVYYEMLQTDRVSALDELAVKCRTANIIALAGGFTSTVQRDLYRAKYAANELKRLIKIT